MCYVSVRCFNCGATYDMYFVEREPQICPHCLATMPDKPYKKIRDAMLTVEEVNKDFRKANNERGRPLFQIEVRNHYVPPEKFNV